jgi:hypothetical protein
MRELARKWVRYLVNGRVLTFIPSHLYAQYTFAHLVIRSQRNVLADECTSQNMSSYIGSEVLTTVIVKSSVFWDITPCSPSKVNRSFGGTCRLHLQGRKINQRESRWQAWNIFLRNVVESQPKFRRDMSPPSPGPRSIPSKKQTWKQVAGRRHTPPKRRLIFSGLHGVESKTIELFTSS